MKRIRDFIKRSQPSRSFLMRSEKLQLSPDDSATQSRRALFDINQVCSELTGLFRIDLTDSGVRARILQLVQSCRAFHLEYDPSSEGLPQIWKYQDIELLLLKVTGRATLVNSPSKPIHVYQDIWFAATRNFYRLGVIILHETLLKCAAQLETLEWSISDDVEKLQWRPDVKRSEEVINRTKVGICVSISNCLGDVDSHGNLMPNVPSTAPEVISCFSR